MRIMFDSVTASAIPADAVMVAGYVDGVYRWAHADWDRFPNAVQVRIAVHPGTDDGQVLDVERGDATPAQAPAWVVARRAVGVDPSVYCSLAVWDEVKAAFAGAGVVEPHYWIAAYPGNGPNLYPGSVAHQYRDTGPNGENVDMSVVADFWPGVDTEENDLTDDEHTMLEHVHAWMSADLKGYNPEVGAPGSFRSTPAMLQDILSALKNAPAAQPSGGVTLDQVRQVVRDELNATKLGS